MWKILTVAVALGAASPTFATPYVFSGLSFQLDVPAGWEVTGEASAYPFQVTYAGGGAELQIFRTDLQAGQSINTADELKKSVQRVVDSVILGLPNAKLITNTGYDEGTRIGFALEFISADPSTHSPLRHRLFGWLYRHPDGHQILFTLWGKGLVQSYTQQEDGIKQMQATFEYTGPQESTAMATGSRRYVIPLLVIVLLAVASLYYRSARMRANQKPLTSLRSWWSCSCGCRNVDGIGVCKQCGQPRPAATVR